LAGSGAIRILYAAGPGDIVGTYRHWAAGRDDPSQVAVTYSSQFYDFCRDTGALGYVISSHPRREKISEGNLIIEHRRTFFPRGPGPLYHLGQILLGLRLTLSAILFRADFAVVADATHWFALCLMPVFGVKVVPTLHCVLWAKQRPPSGRIDKLVWVFNGMFFRRCASAIMSLSSDITKQVLPLLRGRAVPIFPFLPTYRPEAFGDGFGPPPAPPPFLVFFAGRIEKNKGVFDLLEIAKGYAADGRTDIEFDLCGDGSQLEALRQAAIAAGLQERFRLHGHTARPAMRELYERCHVVIVPTTTEFVEGFNKVVAEGVLAGRPVITSSVCPALEYVRAAVVEVPPDNAAAYGDAILQLKNDPELYERKRQASREVRSQFCDVKMGWRAAMTRATGRE
jgi:glycosyltransferase involved in cell wall biosynthesis